MIESAPMKSYLIRGARIVKPTRVLDGDLLIENGIITCIGGCVQATDEHTVIEAGGSYVVPGFVDIHTHGGMGLDLTEGEFDPQTGAFDRSPGAYERGFPRLMAHLASNGTTRVLLSTVAAPQEQLRDCLGHLGRYVHSDANGRDGARLEGAFLEGTFISNPEFAGAQNPAYFFRPAMGLFDHLNDAALNTIRYVNVAPEWGDAAVDLIRELTRRDITVGAGHTQAPADQYLRAVAAGLSVAVHFTNGPTGSTFKPFGGGGVLQAVLRSHRVYAELICDGYHVNPLYVRDIIHRKTPARIIAITDAMFPAGRTDVQEFEVAGVRGRVSENGRYLAVTGKQQTLFGSIIGMRDAFSNLLSWLTRTMPGIWVEEHEDLETEEALVEVARICSTNPANALGIFDPVTQRLDQDLSHLSGGIQVGKRGDAVVIRLDGQPGDYRVEVLHTLAGGRLFEPVHTRSAG